MSGIFKLNGVDYMGGGGGGGNANDMELTYDEYEELSEAEKTNGTNYFITDIDNFDNNTNFRPVIYSTLERNIGVWTDGKPLYQKTLSLTSPSSTNDVVIADLSSLSIDTLASISGILYSTTVHQYIPLLWSYNANTMGSVYYQYNSNELRQCVSSSGYLDCQEWITLQYTKITDQPGSGTWSPQGIPAIHYSTEEQAVGTWINGKTIYEKTWSFDNPTKYSTSGYYYYLPSMDLANLEAIISYICTVYDTTDGRIYTLPYTRILSNEDIKCQCLILNINSTCDLSTQVFFSSSQAYNLTNITWTVRYVKKS